MSDRQNELPKGLLSFTYNAIYNPATNAGARLDLVQELSKFGLSDEVKAIILAAQIGGVPNSESGKKLVELLVQEVTGTVKDLLRKGEN